MIKFPNSIDDRLYLSDLKLSQKDIDDNYQKLLSENKLSEASQYINSSDVSFIGAEVLNELQDELIAIINYVNTIKQGKQLVISNAFPPDPQVGTNWISSREDLDNSIDITTASELYTDQDTGIIE